VVTPHPTTTTPETTTTEPATTSTFPDVTVTAPPPPTSIPPPTTGDVAPCRPTTPGRLTDLCPTTTLPAATHAAVVAHRADPEPLARTGWTEPLGLVGAATLLAGALCVAARHRLERHNR
jgi:hypothetical protein